METQYDLVVIGAGPGGYPAALKAAKLGKKVAVVENRDLGGTCLNRGCIPAKTLLHTSGLYREICGAGQFGIRCETPKLDMPRLWQHKDEVVQSLRDGIWQGFKKQNVTLYKGSGQVVEPGTVKVGLSDGTAIVLSAAHILIATGSRPAIPPIPGAELEGVIDSDYILDENRLSTGGAGCFSHITIVGGGVIGMEMATVYSNIGSQVTVIEAMDRILPGMDKEISQNLKMIMKKRGVEIHTTSAVKEIVRYDGGLICRYEEKGRPMEVRADGILISAGRKPNTEGLFAQGLIGRIEMERGYVKVGQNYETGVSGIYAIGDVIGGIQLAHMATAEGCHAVNHMFGLACSQNLSVIPSCVYTNPEIASVGISADEAKAAGLDVKTGKYIMSVNGKSVLSKQERGFIKLVAEAGTGKLVGAQLMCARATDLVGGLGLAIAKGLTTKDVAEVVMAHPTFGEGIAEAAKALCETESCGQAPGWRLQ